MSDTPIPPHDLETEAQVLGALLCDEQAVLPVMECLAQRHAFYRDSHENAFNAAWRIWSKGQRVTAATAKLEATGDKAVEVIDKAVAAAKAWGVDRGDLPAMCQRLLELKERRDHLFWGQKVVQYAEDTSKRMDTLRGLAAFIPKTIGAPLDADPHVDEGIEEMLAKAADTERKGYVPTGVGYLDRLLDGGFAPGHLNVLGARRTTGKTAVGSAMALHAMRRNLKIAWVSCEMGRVEMLGRWATALSGVALSHRSTPLTEGEQERLDKAVAFLSYSQPVLVDHAISLEDLCTSAMRWRAQKRLDLLVIDYIQIMKLPDGNSMHERLTEFVTGLKALARTLNVPVLALAQCRRESDPQRQKREVQMAHLKGSGGLEETADSVLLFWMGEEPRKLECHLAKNRHGPAGRFALYADFGRMSIGEWREA